MNKQVLEAEAIRVLCRALGLTWGGGVGLGIFLSEYAAPASAPVNFRMPWIIAGMTASLAGWILECAIWRERSAGGEGNLRVRTALGWFPFVLLALIPLHREAFLHVPSRRYLTELLLGLAGTAALGLRVAWFRAGQRHKRGRA